MLREFIAEGRLPDFRLEEMPGDLIRVTPRKPCRRSAALSTETLEAARALVPGADVYALEAEWRAISGTFQKYANAGANKVFLDWLVRRAAD